MKNRARAEQSHWTAMFPRRADADVKRIWNSESRDTA